MRRKRNSPTNHRRRLMVIARRHGIMVKGVSNWEQLAQRIEHFTNSTGRGGLDAKRFCYRFMEGRGWI